MELLWTLVGWAANACFFSRFLVQWAVSERAGEVRVPSFFWYLSLSGALLLAAYSMHRAEWVLFAGHAVNGIVYSRNLALRRRRSGRRLGPIALATLAAVGGAVLLAAVGQRVPASRGVDPWIWLAVLGQSIWGTRFLVQWWISERRGKSQLPPAFWLLSLAGNGPLLAYAAHLGDPVFIAGYLPGPIVQVRNLVLARRAGREAREASRARTVGGVLATVAVVVTIVLVGHNARLPRLAGAPNELPGPTSMPAAVGPRLDLLAVGDTGHPNLRQRAVARAMSERAVAIDPALVLLLGDNFYPDGVASADDPQWQETFVEPFDRPALDVPFYAVLGNHDHDGTPEAQILWGEGESKWRMPAARYRVDLRLDDGTEVLLAMLDTTPLSLRVGGAEEQYAWLDEVLAASDARWKIVVGHHPLLTGGRPEGGDVALNKKLAPILREHGVALYVSGHDHYQAVLEDETGIVQLVTGAGSKPRDAAWTEQTRFASIEPGFAHLRIEPEVIWIELVGAGSGSLFAWRIEG